LALVMGVDSSTQSCKVVVRDADSGVLLRQGRAEHPSGTEVDPAQWERAARTAIAQAGGLDDISALSIGAQQHGMVCLDESGRTVRPAILWNDTRSAQAAQDLVTEFGAGFWAEAVGSVPVASFTVTKLRWLAEHEPGNAERVAAVCLPHDWLSWRLAGARGLDMLFTDRSDASGTGYWSPATGQYRLDLLRAAFGREVAVPDVNWTSEPSAETPEGVLIGPGAGDNAAAALGLGARAGDVVVSVGTSGVVSALSPIPSADASGLVAGFAAADGGYLPLACTLNGARVLDAVAALLGVDHARLSQLALSAPAGAGGLIFVPYLDGERTPNLPNANGALHGVRVDNLTPANLARAAIEGILCGLADAVDALRAQQVSTERYLLTGGAAASEALQLVAPNVLGAAVTVPEPGEYVADGAARQAAWVLSGDRPEWPVGLARVIESVPSPEVRQRYADVRAMTLR